MKVVFCTPSLTGPTAPYLKALEDSIPLIIEAGWEEAYIQEVGCPYISHARAKMTRRALDAKADIVVYLDYDVSWDPKDLLTLIETKGDVVAGTYRYKKDEEEYMGSLICNRDNTPCVRNDGTIRGHTVPAGFLKVTRGAIRLMMREFPELLIGDAENPTLDLFQHGAHKWVWYGEDMAFSRRWKQLGQEIVIVPDLNLNHHATWYDREAKEFKTKVYPGNFHKFLMAQPRPEGAK